MMLSAAESSSRSIPATVVVLVLLIGGTIYVFGYLRAVMHRANVDYKKTKEGLPGMRKAFWAAWWSAVKVGFWVLLIVAFLIVWMIRGDPKDDAGKSVKPAPSTSHSRR
jgi:hypothetical protein